MRNPADDARGTPEGRPAGLAALPFVMFSLDAQGVFTALEGDGLATLGLQAGELVGRSAFKVYRGEPGVIRSVRRALSGESFEAEVEIGGVAFRCRYDPLRDGRGGVVGAMGLAAEAGELLKLGEDARLRERAMTASSEGIVITDPNLPDGPIVYVNPAFEAMTGYTAGEALGRNCRFLQGAERDQPALGELRAALAEGRACTVVLRNYRRDGTPFWNELSVTPILGEGGGLANFVGVQKDVTERVEREEELWESEERFRLLAEQSLEGIVLSEHGEILDANLSFSEMFGYGIKELAGRDVAELVAWEQQEAVARRIYEEDVRPYESLGLRKDGSTFPMELRPRRIPYQGRHVRVTSVVDLTERKRAEASLAKSEELFRVTFDQAAAGMAHVAPDGRWLRVNDELCAIVGYGKEELLGLTFQDITHPDDLGKDLRQVGRMLAGKIHSYRMEKRYVRKDGRRIWADLSVSMVREGPSGGPSCFVSVVKDVTEAKLRELVPEPLLPKELEVLHLIAEGKTNPKIAGALNYSLGMIKLRVQRIIAKLGVGDRDEAVARAVEIGLLPDAR